MTNQLVSDLGFAYACLFTKILEHYPPYYKTIFNFITALKGHTSVPVRNFIFFINEFSSGTFPSSRSIVWS